MRWTGTDCGRAIRERGRRLREQGKLPTTSPEGDADGALMTMAKLLTGSGEVDDHDCRQLEAWLERRASCFGGSGE
jgi:hypothetical protein